MLFVPPDPKTGQALLLLLSVPLSFVLRFISKPLLKHLFSVFIGVFGCFWAFGGLAWHVVLPPIGVFLIMKFLRTIEKTLHLSRKIVTSTVSLLIFSHLLYVHVWREFFLPQKYSSGTGFEGSLQITVLRMISVLFCYADSSVDDKSLTKYQQKHKLKHMPTFIEFISYSLSFVTISVGPWIEIDHYIASMNRNKNPKGSTRVFFIKLGEFFICAIPAFLGLRYFNKEWLLRVTDSQPAHIVLLVTYLFGTLAALKYEAAWLLGECSCIGSTLSYDDESKEWNKCTNIVLKSVELPTSPRESITGWNRLVSKWLNHYVNARVSKKKELDDHSVIRSSFSGMFITFMASALWHGIRPGYFIFFALLFVGQMSSKLWYKRITPILPENTIIKAVYRAGGFITGRFLPAVLKNALDFPCISFYLLYCWYTGS
ncbi:hypothetical protein PCE1_002902 [Barthelona sp. PCE]